MVRVGNNSLVCCIWQKVCCFVRHTYHVVVSSELRWWDMIAVVQDEHMRSVAENSAWSPPFSEVVPGLDLGGFPLSYFAEIVTQNRHSELEGP